MINRATKGEAVPVVSLAVTRFGDFGDHLAMAATVDGAAPGEWSCDILSVYYRGRSVALVSFPMGADRQAVSAAVLARADYFLGSRCPDMDNYPLSFD